MLYCVIRLYMAKDSITYKNGKLCVTQSIVFLEQGKIITAYSPAFDLCGYGYTQEEAVKVLQETSDHFFKDGIKEGFLLEELQKLGWKFIIKQDDIVAQSPSEEALKKQISDILKFADEEEEVDQIYSKAAQLQYA